MLLHTFITRSREVMHPAKLSLEYSANTSLWIQYQAQDSSFLHPVIFSISLISRILGHHPHGTKSGAHHWGKTLAFLNGRLSDSRSCTHNSTIWVVLSLVILFSSARDYAAAVVHIRGLGEMVRLRGGLAAFRRGPRLYAKLSRTDLAYSLYSGEKPVFAGDASGTSSHLAIETLSPWGCSWDGTASMPGAAGAVKSISGITNCELLAVFADLRRLCRALNAAAESPTPLYAVEFQDQICSVQYRLLGLQGCLDDALAECLRLAMLAFLSTTSQVPGTRGHYPYLSRRFRETYDAVRTSAPQLQGLVLWVLTIGAISIFDVVDPWLRGRWKAEVSPDMSWRDARQCLVGFPWIDYIHDQAALAVFEMLNLEEAPGMGSQGCSSDTATLWASGWAGCTYEFR
ncbi:hypothetical protein B0T26DRAFT_876230 [Lasiosphaeria miniovina]|uniref:Uncharacterized protein n=1 Tax=Lasiosphaeria miniovina TaxID=1954250 RepID=A0AA40DKE9_9PEZI|nr:uncharacterized protein B0T26DRAFT_876230 [Lasiosphaeria miniovina]KAK0703083.1 hypothetical protein B0T26DRAFT_876230 [Lasiosphaeria miniovina]